MGKEQILVTCPWCKGQNVIDDESLGDISNGIMRPNDKPEDIMNFGFTCLDCGEHLSTQCMKKDYDAILRKIFSGD